MLHGGPAGGRVERTILSSAFKLAVAVAVTAIVLVLSDLAGASANAQSTNREIPRTVLAIYDGRFEAEPDETRVHLMLEMPLNFLGYKVTYWDLRDGLPDPRPGDDIAALLTWFEEPILDGPNFFSWALQFCEKRRLIILGHPGNDENWATRALTADLLGRLGLAYSGESVDLSYGKHVLSADVSVVGFERPVGLPLRPFPLVVKSRPDVAPHLVLSSDSDRNEAQDEGSAVVATSPRGGFASSNYTYFYEPNTNRRVWILNPFEFLNRALGQIRFPVPDVTTVSGRRIYISHIDGDGWNNLSEMQIGDEKTLSAEVVLNRLIAPFPDLPVTVGLIGGDADPKMGGVPASAGVARELFALRQVEVASHTYTHPFTWSFFENYSRDAELKLMAGAQMTDSAVAEGFLASVFAGGAESRVAGSNDLPRAYLMQPFNLKQEIVGSLDFASLHAPAGKKAEAILWSGDAEPFEKALKAAREAGVVNINGGDTRYDSDFPSVSYVPPIARQIGSERQIYALSSNENNYTENWTDHFYGFSRLAETIKNTEAPRRLKGVDIYYHMYSGERVASLKAVEGHLNWARAADITPITTSQYAKIAEGFFTTRIEAIGQDRWLIADRGDLQTLRLPGAAGFHVNFAQSAGIVGYTEANGDLYVALDGAARSAVLTVAEGPTPLGRPYLVESRWEFTNIAVSGCETRGQIRGFGPGALTLGGASPGRYRLRVYRSNNLVWEEDAHVKEDGVLRAVVHADGREPLDLEVTCDAG
jgi:hypothetical protein